MSVLIKGMDMPCMCCLCPCHSWDMETNRYYCQALKDEPIIIDENTRRDDCPLSEIPTPHGDLIDRSKIHYCHYDLPNYNGSFYAAEDDWINEMTPIIEAEE